MFKCLKSKSIVMTIIMIVILVGSLAGCGSQNASAKNPAVKDIDAKIKQTVDISAMRQGDINKLEKIYNVKSDDIDEFVLYTAPSNIKADEIAIIKVKDSSKVNDIKDKISKRLDDQSTSFKDYLPDEYYLLQKNVLKTNGNYILFVVSKDADKIESTFDGFFK